MDQASFILHSDGATGGVCNEQRRIHRAMMTRDTRDSTFMSASFSRQFQLRYGLEIGFSFRSRIPLSIPLQPACGPGDSGHTDLPWLAPSSTYKVAVPLAFPSRSKPLAGN